MAFNPNKPHYMQQQLKNAIDQEDITTTKQLRQKIITAKVLNPIRTKSSSAQHICIQGVILAPMTWYEHYWDIQQAVYNICNRYACISPQSVN